MIPKISPPSPFDLLQRKAALTLIRSSGVFKDPRGHKQLTILLSVGYVTYLWYGSPQGSWGLLRPQKTFNSKFYMKPY